MQRGAEEQSCRADPGQYLVHPGRVDRLFLLCPGFDLASRIESVLSASEMEDWERKGEISIDTAAWGPLPLHWRFVVDARAHPAYPEVSSRYWQWVAD